MNSASFLDDHKVTSSLTKKKVSNLQKSEVEVFLTKSLMIDVKAVEYAISNVVYSNQLI